jgi:hypothetical protein
MQRGVEEVSNSDVVTSACHYCVSLVFVISGAWKSIPMNIYWEMFSVTVCLKLCTVLSHPIFFYLTGKSYRYRTRESLLFRLYNTLATHFEFFVGLYKHNQTYYAHNATSKRLKVCLCSA